MQFLLDIGAVQSEEFPIDDDAKTVDQLVGRIEDTIKLIEEAQPEAFAAKEEQNINVFLGSFSIDRRAIDYVHDISLPSL